MRASCDTDGLDRGQRVLDLAAPVSEQVMAAALDDPSLLLHLMTGAMEPASMATLATQLLGHDVTRDDVEAERQGPFYVAGRNGVLGSPWPSRPAPAVSWNSGTRRCGSVSGAASSMPPSARLRFPP